MASPLQTVPNWVPNIINPQILFITENYPSNPNTVNKNTFFYRHLIPGITINGGNNLLNNLCKSLNIVGNNEGAKLNNFLQVRNYFLIDTFPCGQPMSKMLIRQTINNPAWIDIILDDILYINPKQIVFTCVGSNGALLPILLNRASQRGLHILGNVVANTLGNNNYVFHSPSNRAFQTFMHQIQFAINNGSLIP